MTTINFKNDYLELLNNEFGTRGIKQYGWQTHWNHPFLDEVKAASRNWESTFPREMTDDDHVYFYVKMTKDKEDVLMDINWGLEHCCECSMDEKFSLEDEDINAWVEFVIKVIADWGSEHP